MSSAIYFSLDFIDKYYLCAFDYYDAPLSGLIQHDNEILAYKFCREYVVPLTPATCDDSYFYARLFTIHDFDRNGKWQEFLEDYRVAYRHWFKEDGCRLKYEGQNLAWFEHKWGTANPFLDTVGEAVDYVPFRIREDL